MNLKETAAYKRWEWQAKELAIIGAYQMLSLQPKVQEEHYGDDKRVRYKQDDMRVCVDKDKIASNYDFAED
jgi:hypothetical protein